MKHKEIRLYDNGGKTVDRYTALNTDARYSSGASDLVEAIGFSENPYHPQGFGQHTGAMPGRHLGKRIDPDDLPPMARMFFNEFVAEYHGSNV